MRDACENPGQAGFERFHAKDEGAMRFPVLGSVGALGEPEERRLTMEGDGLPSASTPDAHGGDVDFTSCLFNQVVGGEDAFSTESLRWVEGTGHSDNAKWSVHGGVDSETSELNFLYETDVSMVLPPPHEFDFGTLGEIQTADMGWQVDGCSQETHDCRAFDSELYSGLKTKACQSLSNPDADDFLSVLELETFWRLIQQKHGLTRERVESWGSDVMSKMTPDLRVLQQNPLLLGFIIIWNPMSVVAIMIMHVVILWETTMKFHPNTFFTTQRMPIRP